MTQKELFEALLGLSQVQAQPELVEGLQTRLEALSRKASQGGLTEVEKVARATLETQVLEVLTRSMRVTEVVQALATQGVEASASKVTARLTSLVKQGLVERTVVKGKAFYSKVEA